MGELHALIFEGVLRLSNWKKNHRLWIRKQREKYGNHRTDPHCADKVYCEVCYCDGNCECDHKRPIGGDCSLDSITLTCPCCDVESDPATDVEYDESVGQDRLKVEFMDGTPKPDWLIEEERIDHNSTGKDNNK